MTLTIGDLKQNLKKMSAQSTLGDDTPIYVHADASLAVRWRGNYVVADILDMSIEEDSEGHEYCFIRANKSNRMELL